MKLERLVAALITRSIRLLTGVQARWLGCAPTNAQRVYFANHSSHLDFILLWSVLPPALRQRTRPVAAKDYWATSAPRRFLIHRVFRGLLIERTGLHRDENPIAIMLQALDAGDSLILFPEGTRGRGEEVQPFKAGLFHLVEARPGVEFVPAFIDNAYRVMPKGAALPIPLLCSIAFGKPVHPETGESKTKFLERSRQALLELATA
jgi:1-acyl-sn-glycerol-3-phosphate acyltransferase